LILVKMAILSAFTLIRLISVFHLTIAYYLLSSPITLSSQNVVVVLGGAMQLPLTDPFPKSSTPLSAIGAIAFALLGIIDFTSAGMNEQIAYHYWASQGPVRLLFLFGLTAYSYLAKASTEIGKFAKPSPGDGLKNGLVFTWAFVELGVWFLIYISIRDEMSNMRRTRKLDDIKDE